MPRAAEKAEPGSTRSGNWRRRRCPPVLEVLDDPPKGLREEVKNLPTVTQTRDKFQQKMVLGGSERLEVSE